MAETKTAARKAPAATARARSGSARARGAERSPAAAVAVPPVATAGGTGATDPRPARRPPARGRKAKRRVRWSARRERTFLEHLAETANVAASVRLSGLSESSVYRRRREHEDFRGRWATALSEGFARLETMMLERALAGTEKAVWHGGRQVGTVHEYDNRLALALLGAHRPAVTGEAAAGPRLSDEELFAKVCARLSEINARMGGDG